MNTLYRSLAFLAAGFCCSLLPLHARAQQEAGQGRVTPLDDTGVLRADIRPEKLFFRTGEPVTGVVTLSNLTAQARTVNVRAWLEQELDRKAGVQTQTVTVAAHGSQPVRFSWPAADVAPFGQALAVDMAAGGQTLASGREYFGRADTVWEVAIGALPNGPASSSANYSDEQIVRQIRQFRDQYCNVWEKYFWAPDDWGQLTTAPGATWYSCQARRHENTEKLKLQVDASHAQGIAVVTYGKCMAGGVPGWELARARPQWFVTDQIGRTMGRPADVWDLDNWQTGKYEDYKYIWTYRWVDLRRLDALDHGIQELIASTKQFGWDGVRFDSGGFRASWVDGRYPGNDAVNTRNMKRTKERLWDAVPPYLFGYNTDNTASMDGRAYPLTVAEMSHEMREMLAGGGLWMGEAIKDFSNGSVQYKTWSHYARDERRCIEAIREAGGQFCYLFHHSTPVRDVYQFAIGLMIGAHPYGGEHVGLAGSENWGRFLTRWSGLLWDPRLRALDAAKASLSVTASRPLWWKEFANERLVGADRRQVIVHLLNPPADDEIARVLKALPKDVLELADAHDGKAAGNDDEVLLNLDSSADALLGSAAEVPQLAPDLLAAARAQRFPPPASNGVVTVRIPAGQTPRTAWFIAPGTPNRAMAANWKAADGAMVVTVPDFAVWAMVVCEFEGSFPASAPRPRFSEPLTEAETADLERQAPKPAEPMPWFGLRPPAATLNVAVADDLLNPAPQHDPAVTAADEPTPDGIAAPDGLTVGGATGLDVLVVNGFYHAFHRVAAAIRSVRPDARIVERTTRDLPKDYEDLFAHDLIVLVDMGADAWDAAGRKRLADFAEAGGRLAVLGGPFTLGQGYFKNTPLERVLPVEVRVARDVYQLPAPMTLGDRKGKPFADRPLLYYYHAVTPRPEATPLLWAGELPILWERKVGKGSSVVFAGAPLGESTTPEETPFWKSNTWLEGFGRALIGAAP